LFDADGELAAMVNTEMVDIETVEADDALWLKRIIDTHLRETESAVARRLLNRWHESKRSFVKVMPRDYKRVLEAMQTAEERGITADEAVMVAAHG
jgi:glutamate synthase (NADPH/NADH) large chain